MGIGFGGEECFMGVGFQTLGSMFRSWSGLRFQVSGYRLPIHTFQVSRIHILDFRSQMWDQNNEDPRLWVFLNVGFGCQAGYVGEDVESILHKLLQVQVRKPSHLMKTHFL